MRVIFCVPGNNFSNNFLTSWTKLLKYCHDNGIKAELSNGYTSIVHLARYSCLRIDVHNTGCEVCKDPFEGKEDYNYIMWIDSDMVFEPEDFQKLLDAKEKVITGLYKVEASNEYACFENKSNKRINEDYLKKNKGVIETSFAGMGFMLIKGGVFEKMKFPYFSIPGHAECVSETISFCHNLKTAGIPLHAHLDVIIGHEKPQIL
jgi:hypothetical protein